nr:farnesyl diphosphate synthase [Oleiagrimonas sp. C23AA]
MAAVLPAETADPATFHRAMRYAVLGGGKRLRPLLVYAAGLAVDGDGAQLDAPACAVELIHAYSLVHDDLPAMDDDALRRGRPTCHVVFGEATAILAGDALQALAFELLARDEPAGSISADARLRMLATLGQACGSAGMAGGQAVDLDSVGQALDLAGLERMHAMKTGALIRGSVRLGALAGHCDDDVTLGALDTYAHAVGLAFQVRDDILDVEGATEVIGKTAGKDAANDKPTFPALLGMDASHRHLAELIEQARDAIAPLGKNAGLLAWLARYTAERKH